MAKRDAILLVVVAVLVLGAELSSARRRKASKDDNLSNKGVKGKQGRLFSLFNVVSFTNTGCTASASNRQGNCFTAAECANRGGSSAGKCAAGFGVCCISIISASGSTAVENCTYIQNPGFPTTISTAGAVSYTVRKLSSDICSLRLDFQMFTIRANTMTTEVTDMHNCMDTFTMMGAGTTTRPLPVICGENRGQHVYLDFGRSTGTGDITLAFNLAANPTAMWDIKTSQIECGSIMAPPNGCLQYHTTLSGRLTSFNFANSGQTHLPNQDYSICIRKDQGTCCIKYNVCMDAGSFSLSSGSPMLMNGPVAGTMIAGMFNFAAEDTNCFRDYIRIPGGQSMCSTELVNDFHDRFCGTHLHTRSTRGGDNRNMAMATDLESIMNQINIPICDCTPPFTVDVVTDNLPDNVLALFEAGNIFSAIAKIPVATIMPNTMLSRGVCLEYSQVAC